MSSDLPPEYLKRYDVDRTYRSFSASDLTARRIVVGESDLLVLASREETHQQITSQLKKIRLNLKSYIERNPFFVQTLTPYPQDLEAPPIVQRMIDSAARTGVGPMAAVAGAISAELGESSTDPELIIENGGDIFLRSRKERIIAIYAGASIFSNRIGIKIPPQLSDLGICTSAGTVGPSLSLGKSDATVIIAHDPALADAAATAVGNLIQTPNDLSKALNKAQNIAGILGCVLIKEDKIAIWGEYELVSLTSGLES